LPVSSKQRTLLGTNFFSQAHNLVAKKGQEAVIVSSDDYMEELAEGKDMNTALQFHKESEDHKP
jgi:hypothetical protein